MQQPCLTLLVLILVATLITLGQTQRTEQVEFSLLPAAMLSHTPKVVQQDEPGCLHVRSKHEDSGLFTGCRDCVLRHGWSVTWQICASPSLRNLNSKTKRAFLGRHLTQVPAVGWWRKRCICSGRTKKPV